MKMNRPKLEYFKYRCSVCDTLLSPINHEYNRLGLSVSWQNYYCHKCNQIRYTDYGFEKSKKKETIIKSTLVVIECFLYFELPLNACASFKEFDCIYHNSIRV